MAFQVPRSIENAKLEGTPHLIVTIGSNEPCPIAPEARHVDWDLPDPAGVSIENMRNIRDDIEKRVAELIGTL
jgi:ArsR family transcriptional regulator